MLVASKKLLSEPLEGRTVPEILMLSGIFSAVRIWSERAVTTLLHLTLADLSTGCPIIGLEQRERVEFPPSPSLPVVVGDPSVIRCRESCKTNGTIFATDRRPNDRNGVGQRLPQQHFFRLKNVAGGFTFAAESPDPNDTKFFSFLVAGFSQSCDFTRMPRTAKTNVRHSMLRPTLILRPEAIRS